MIAVGASRLGQQRSGGLLEVGDSQHGIHHSGPQGQLSGSAPEVR